MKYLFSSVICFTLVISVFGAPQTNSISDFVTEDDVARKIIADQVKMIEKLSDDNEFARSILKSIDQKCMLEKYKNYKFVNEMLTEAAFELDGFGSPENSVDPFIVFADIALMCSSKLDAVLRFAFSNLFSYSELLEAFREDEPFKEIIDDFVCYNNYAVKTNLLDPNTYPRLQDQPTNKTDAECDEAVEGLRKLVFESLEFFSEFVVSDHRQCLRTEISEAAEKFFLKYILLIPLGLTDEQKLHEKKNFVNDAREGLEKILVCNAKEKEDRKINEISYE